MGQYAPTKIGRERVDFRERMIELLKKRKDPDYVRDVFVNKLGIDSSVVDTELEDILGLPPENTVEVDGRQFQINTIADQKAYSEMQAKEQETAQMASSAMEDFDTKLSQINTALEDKSGLKAAVGVNFLGRAPIASNFSGAKQRFLGAVDQIVSVDALNALIDAKSAGATFGALSEGELKLLKSSATKFGTWEVRDKNGTITGYDVDEKTFKKELENIKALTEKAKGKLEAAQPATQEQQTQQIADYSADLNFASAEEAKAYAAENPNDPRTAKIREQLQMTSSVGETDTLGGNENLKNALNGIDLPDTREIDKRPASQKIGEAIGSFLGGDQIGQAIGTLWGIDAAKKGEAGETFKRTIAEIEKKFQEGKITEDKRNSLLDAQQKNAEEAFKYDGPNARQLAGDLGKIALTIGSIAAGGVGSKSLATAAEGGILRGAGMGALQGAGFGAVTGGIHGGLSELESDRELETGNMVGSVAKEAVTGGLFGGVIGGLIGGVMGAGNEFKTARQNSLASNIDDGTPPPPGNQTSTSIPETSSQSGTLYEQVVDVKTAQNPKVEQTITSPANSKIIKEANKQGWSDRDIKLIADLSPEDKKTANIMMELADKADESHTALRRPIDEAGKTLNSKLKYADGMRMSKGKELEKVANELRGQTLDVSSIKQQSDELLGQLGIVKNNKGKLDFSNSVFKLNEELQGKISKFVNSLPEESADAYQLHISKRAIDEAVNYGVSGEGLKGNSENVLKTIRRSIDGLLDENFSQYKVVNDEYRALAEVTREARSLFGRNYKAGASDIKAGQLLRGVMSNNSNRGRILTLAEQLDNVGLAYGDGPAGSAVNQALFSQMLEDSGIYNLQSVTGFRGQIESGLNASTATKAAIQTANAVKGGPWSAGLHAIEKGVEGIRNVNPIEKKSILRMLMKELTDGNAGLSIKNIAKDVESIYVKKYGTKEGLKPLMDYIKKDGMKANSMEELGGNLTKAGFDEGADSEIVSRLWDMIQKNPGSF